MWFKFYKSRKKLLLLIGFTLQDEFKTPSWISDDLWAMIEVGKQDLE
jgi:hypothetical protein